MERCEAEVQNAQYRTFSEQQWSGLEWPSNGPRMGLEWPSNGPGMALDWALEWAWNRSVGSVCACIHWQARCILRPLPGMAVVLLLAPGVGRRVKQPA